MREAYLRTDEIFHSFLRAKRGKLLMDGIKIKENKGAYGVETAKYYISYSGKGNNDVHRKKSYDIISALKGDRDVLIEMKSSLLSLEVFKREKCSIDFLKGVKDLGLSFRSRKVPAKDSGSILTKLFSFGQTPKDAYEIIAHVPGDTWNDPGFKSIIPYFGVMYYICKENSDAPKIMDDLFNGQIFDEEKFDLFKFFIYDCTDFGQMGVFTKDMEYADLERILCGK